MEADPITIIAQVVNFALLVLLLKRFLYQPILDAMDRREAKIEERLAAARDKSQAAEERAEEYDEKVDELEKSKREVMEEVREEAHERALELHEELREKIEQREREWAETLSRQAVEQVDSFRDEVRTEIVATVREALRDLADRDLEAQMLATFLEQVENLPDEEAEALRGTDRPGPPLTIVTSKPVTREVEERLVSRLRGRFGESAKFVFETDESLVAGIELRCQGHRLGWNVDDYLDVLEKSVRARIDEMVRQAPPLKPEESDARDSTP